jgi:hypothetical protein
MEQPILRLGLLGYSAAQIQTVLRALAGGHASGWPRWQLADFLEADAWCINGEQVSAGSDDQLVVNMLLEHLPQVSLNPAHISHPLAFSPPLPAGVESSETCHLEDTVSLRRTLQRFEAWLRPLRAQFALGAELVARESDLNPGVYHLNHRGRLIAIIDLIKWHVGLLASARPVDIEESVWDHRPAGARDIPPSFIKMSVVELMWTYAVRTQQDVLPERYRKSMIYMRRVPNLPVGWLGDEHLVVLRALSASPLMLVDLAHKCEMSVDMTSRAVAALYYGGSVTTNSRTASQPEREKSPVGDESSIAPLTSAGDDKTEFLPSVPGVIRHRPSALDDDDTTAPAPLMPSMRIIS